jgi:hypothetical protein
VTLPNAMIKAVPLSRPTELLAAIDSVATTLYVADDAVGRDTDGNLIAPIRLVFGIGPGAEEVYCPTAPVDRHYEGVTRGAGGTTARAWPKGTPVARRFSGTDWDGVIGNIDALDGRVGTLEGAPAAGALDDLTDVTITTPADGDVVTRSGSGWVNAPPTAGTTTTRLSPITVSIAHATTDAATGKTASVDLTANHGLISRIRIRADWVAGQQTGNGTFLVNNGSGIAYDATTIAIDGPSTGLALADGDLVRIDNEVIKCGATTSTSSIANAVRGYAGTIPTYHDDNVQGIKANDGIRLELYPDAGYNPNECLLTLREVMTGKWTTDAAISAGATLITLGASPTLLSDFGLGDLVLIDDTADEVARVQDVYGDVVDANTDDSIRTMDPLAAHDTAKDVYRLVEYDLPTPFKFTGSATTLYLKMAIEEKTAATVTATVELIVEKFA